MSTPERRCRFALPLLTLTLALAATSACGSTDADARHPTREQLRHRARAEIGLDQLDAELTRLEDEITADGG